MNGYVKYFDDGRKNVSFKIEDFLSIMKFGTKLKRH